MNTNPQRSKKTKAKRLAAGLCPMCTTRKLAPGLRGCRRCLNKASDRMKARVAAAKIAGMCRRCPQKPAANGTTVCADCLERSRLQRVAAKLEAFAAYGGNHCACCKTDILDFLTIDHINNDGSAHRKELFGASHGRGGRHFYAWLKRQNWPKGFQVLCFNCNIGKARNNGVCPCFLRR